MTNRCNYKLCQFMQDGKCQNSKERTVCLQVCRDILPNASDRQELAMESQQTDFSPIVDTAIE